MIIVMSEYLLSTYHVLGTMLSTSQTLPHIILTITLLNKDIFIIYYPVLGLEMLSNPIQFKSHEVAEPGFTPCLAPKYI